MAGRTSRQLWGVVVDCFVRQKNYLWAGAYHRLSWGRQVRCRAVVVQAHHRWRQLLSSLEQEPHPLVCRH